MERAQKGERVREFQLKELLLVCPGEKREGNERKRKKEKGKRKGREYKRLEKMGEVEGHRKEIP